MDNTSINQGSIVISAFGGLGKTVFAKNHPDIAIDIEAVPYKYIYHNKSFNETRNENHELLKGSGDRIDNKDFPANYVAELVKNLGRFRFVLIVLSPETLKELEKKNVEYYIVYPDYSSKEAILNRAKSRGNNHRFIDKLNKILSTTDEKEYLLKNLRPKSFFVLKDDQFLEDFIEKKFGLNGRA